MDEPYKILRRLAQAEKNFSLRQIGAACGVSHELIRKIMKQRSLTNISMSSYEKIDKGLKGIIRNGV